MCIPQAWPSWTSRRTLPAWTHGTASTSCSACSVACSRVPCSTSTATCAGASSAVSGHGSALSKLFSYLFCWEQTAAGVRVGYPSLFFAETLQALTAVLTDTQYLKPRAANDVLVARGRIRKAAAALHPRSVGAAGANGCGTAGSAAAQAQAARHLVGWPAGSAKALRYRLRRCGADAGRGTSGAGAPSVLDEPPDLTEVPCNMTMQGTFRSYDELKLADADGWLYTASWDGCRLSSLNLGCGERRLSQVPSGACPN